MTEKIFYSDGAVAYDVQQGDTFNSDIELKDFTYDGQMKDGRLSGGLGQLMDNEFGKSNFRVDSEGRGRKGYEWVGWKNETLLGRPLEILVRFDSLRNFTSFRVHCNNLFSKNVRVFGKVKITVLNKDDDVRDET